MTVRDDFEHRLGQGLKRWAEAGEPTMDLEAHVRQRAGEARAEAPDTERSKADGTPLEVVRPDGAGMVSGPEGAGASHRASRLPRWVRWLSVPAAAAVLVAGLTLTFPAWAGAAATWPLVGPLVQEIILKDAGLAWAYEEGLIQEKLLEVTEGDVTVRILGVVADPRRTTVLYQVTGLPKRPQQPARPVTDDMSPPPAHPWEAGVTIRAIDGVGTASSAYPPIETPLGHFGMVTSFPLTAEEGELELIIRIGEQEHVHTLTVSRREIDSFSWSVAVGQTQEIDGVKVTVHDVVFTPAETVVHYTVEKPTFWGSISGWDPLYILSGGRRLEQRGGGSIAIGGETYAAFPPADSPLTFVIPSQTKAVPVDLTWPLKEGAVAEYGGLPITLTGVTRSGSRILVEWEAPSSEGFKGIGDFVFIGADGSEFNPRTENTGWTSEYNRDHGGTMRRGYEVGLPEGFEPVAVKARQVAVEVRGPWSFEVGE